MLGEIDAGLRPPGTLLVAEDRTHGIVGVGMISAAGSTGEVDALYVSPDRRGEGIGSALFRQLAAAVALACSTIELSVLAANEPARAFYEAIRGERVGSSTFDEEGTALPTAIYRWPTTDLLDPGTSTAGA